MDFIKRTIRRNIYRTAGQNSIGWDCQHLAEHLPLEGAGTSPPPGERKQWKRQRICTGSAKPTGVSHCSNVQKEAVKYTNRPQMRLPHRNVGKEGLGWAPLACTRNMCWVKHREYISSLENIFPLWWKKRYTSQVGSSLCLGP